MNKHPKETDRLKKIVESFEKATITVVGDLVADEFVFGEISRVSREAPVLILRHRETECVPGGGANAANNLADLGARVFPVSVLGEDAAGDALAAYFKNKRVDTSGLVRLRDWRTPTKTRFLAGWTHTARQQVLRMDYEPAGQPPERVAGALEKKIHERLDKSSAMLVSDYGYGSATPARLQAIPAKKRAALPITLDSRYRLHEYVGLGLAAATPNEAELEASHHEEIGGKLSNLESLAQRTMKRLGLRSLVVTRGRDGMTVFERGQSPRSLPVFGSDQAVDVTGAGDTVIAVFTLAVAAGASAMEAAQLANYAGGIVVMKRGTATVTREEILSAIRADATGGSGAGEHA